MNKKHLALAASMIALATMSGHAFAGTTKPNASPEATTLSDSPAQHAFKASHASMVTPPAVEPNAHRYHGGPKVND
jgi:hypothetical protein